MAHSEPIDIRSNIMFYLVLTVVILMSIVVMGLSFPFFLQRLGETNLFFTTVREGTVKAVMRGKSFEHFIMAFTGYHLNNPSKKQYYRADFPDWEVLYHGKGNKNRFTEDDSLYDDRSLLLKHFGLYWIGWPWAHSIYVYAFEWNETITGKDGKEELFPRPEATDFIYVADFTYAIKTDGAETQDRLPTDELTLVTVAVRNPYRALFSGEDWIRRVTSAVNRCVKEFVGSKNFSKLITEDSSELSKRIVLLTKELPDEIEEPRGLKKRYGVVIRTADLQTIELSGEIKKHVQEQTAKEYEAKQTALATELTGTATANVIALTGEKAAEALAKRLAVIEKYGEAGIVLAGYDAIQESSNGPGNTIIWANNPLGVVAGILNHKPKKGDEE